MKGGGDYRVLGERRQVKKKPGEPMDAKDKKPPVPEIPLGLRVKLLEDKVRELDAMLLSLYCHTGKAELANGDRATHQEFVRVSAELKRQPPAQP